LAHSPAVIHAIAATPGKAPVRNRPDRRVSPIRPLPLIEDSSGPCRSGIGKTLEGPFTASSASHEAAGLRRLIRIVLPSFASEQTIRAATRRKRTGVRNRPYWAAEPRA